MYFCMFRIDNSFFLTVVLRILSFLRTDSFAWLKQL
jgi:hypothetical protein